MTIERTFADLSLKLQELQEALGGLAVTVDEDRPRGDDLALAAILSDAVLAASGFLEEARGAAAEAHGAVDRRDMDLARGALVRSQKSFHRFTAHFSAELGSCERLGDLKSLGKERGKAWADWAQVVAGAIEQCRGLIEENRDALFLSWQDLTERMGPVSVTVRTTNVGQQFSLREATGKATKQNGVT